MTLESDQTYLFDIIDNARLIQKFTAGMNREALESDLKTQYAVIRCLEIIGEAAKHISEPFKQESATIRWKEMAGMRDVLIHNYNSIRIAEVWNVIQNDIPHLISQIEPLISPEDEE